MHTVTVSADKAFPIGSIVFTDNTGHLRIYKRRQAFLKCEKCGKFTKIAAIGTLSLCCTAKLVGYPEPMFPIGVVVKTSEKNGMVDLYVAPKNTVY